MPLWSETLVHSIQYTLWSHAIRYRAAGACSHAVKKEDAL
ncbi:hypothetical protein L665_04546 [Ralstonia solanacearum SD54]|nr:hypothetical protein L665_04546 [Ralstonia solanacearum SD54]